jgi:hypothetical protein
MTNLFKESVKSKIVHFRITISLLNFSKSVLGRPTPRLMLTNGSSAPGAAIKAARYV